LKQKYGSLSSVPSQQLMPRHRQLLWLQRKITFMKLKKKQNKLLKNF
jgi:hypothetical protein